MSRTTIATLCILALTATVGCKTKSRRTGSALAQATAAYEAKQYDKCVELSTAAIDAGASAADAYLLRGKAYVKQGDHTHAVADFERVRREDPTRGEAAFRQAQSQLALGQQAQAEATMEWCIGQVYDSLTTRDQMYSHAMYGEVHLALGKYTQAIEEFDAAIKISKSSSALSSDPAIPIIQYNLSRAHFERSNFRRAREAYEGYLEMIQPDADDLYTLAILHFLCGDIRASRELGEKLPAEHKIRLDEALSGETFSVRALYDQNKQTKPNGNNR